MTGHCAWCEQDAARGDVPVFCSFEHRQRYFAACCDLGDELYRTGTVSMLNLHRRYDALARRTQWRGDRAGGAERAATPQAANLFVLFALAIAAAVGISLRYWLAG